MATIEETRRDNLLILERRAGGVGKLAERIGRSSSQVSQWKNASKHSATGKGRGMKDDSARHIERCFELEKGWLDTPHQETEEPATKELAKFTPSGQRVIAVHDDDVPAGLVRIRKVELRLSAGMAGFSVDPVEEDGNPISFRAAWLERRGYNPDKLIAIDVKGQSMEPGLYEGDTVVINTVDRTPKDGEVFAVNYEGEALIKRMVREIGFWWLVSDNPDQRRYSRKRCEGDMCIIIGRVIHKQSERI